MRARALTRCRRCARYREIVLRLHWVRGRIGTASGTASPRPGTYVLGIAGRISGRMALDHGLPVFLCVSCADHVLSFLGNQRSGAYAPGSAFGCCPSSLLELGPSSAVDRAAPGAYNRVIQFSLEEKKEEPVMSDENTQEPEGGLDKNGQRRGLHRRGTKNRATQLLEEMQSQIQQRYGIVNFDPVVMLAMIGVEAAMARPLLDHKGKQVYEYTKNPDGIDELKLDKDGDPIPVMIPPDLALATNALGKAAPYVRSTLRQIEVTDGEDGPIDADVVGAKDRFLLMVQQNPALTAEILAEEEEDDA